MINKPLVDLLRAPDGARDRQLCLGEAVLVYETHEGWAFVEAGASTEPRRRSAATRWFAGLRRGSLTGPEPLATPQAARARPCRHRLSAAPVG
ncbi:MAG: hypothetical protein AAFQ05_12895 [Pseudomonadota bacterium]